MQLRTYPDSGKELQRPFAVHENCYDCVGFYGGCGAWPEPRSFHCRSYCALPDVSAGTWGQEFPATTRAFSTVPASGKGENQSGAMLTLATGRLGHRRQTRPRRRSPAACYGLNGERLCECGASLRKRQRCCDVCRLRRREDTLRHRNSQEWASVVVDAGSGVPFAGLGQRSTRTRIAAHN